MRTCKGCVEVAYPPLSRSRLEFPIRIQLDSNRKLQSASRGSSVDVLVMPCVIKLASGAGGVDIYH